MIFYNNTWDDIIELLDNMPNTIFIPDMNEQYQFHQSLTKEIEDGLEDLTLVLNDKLLKVSKVAEYVPNLFNLSLNTRKHINYLHKQLSSEISTSDLLFTYENIINELNSFMKQLKEQSLIDFTFNSETEITQLFKLLDVKLKEKHSSPIDLLIKYIDLLQETSPIKVLFLLHISYYLQQDELEFLIEHCFSHDIIIVMIEKEKSRCAIKGNSYTIIDGSVLK